MNTWFYFLLSVLATYRLSLLVSTESGPLRVFRKLRRVPPPKSATREGLSCQLCMSIWFAIPITALCWHNGLIVGLGEAALWWLASSAGSIVIHLHTSKNL